MTAQTQTTSRNVDRLQPELFNKVSINHDANVVDPFSTKNEALSKTCIVWSVFMLNILPKKQNMQHCLCLRCLVAVGSLSLAHRRIPFFPSAVFWQITTELPGQFCSQFTFLKFRLTFLPSPATVKISKRELAHCSASSGSSPLVYNSVFSVFI